MGGQGADAGEFLTARELAAVFKLNPQTLYRLARQGMIPAIRIGKKSLRFDPFQVREALQPQGTARARLRPRPARPRRPAFTRFEDVLAQDRWPAPVPNLTLERFAVHIPRGADLAALAYDRKRP